MESIGRLIASAEKGDTMHILCHQVNYADDLIELANTLVCEHPEVAFILHSEKDSYQIAFAVSPTHELIGKHQSKIFQELLKVLGFPTENRSAVIVDNCMHFCSDTPVDANLIFTYLKHGYL